MTRATPCLLALLIASPAWAVPAAFSTQGRMLGADGAPVEGTLELTFRLMDSETGGATVWAEAQSVTFTNGYYSVVLGADEAGNPLSDEVLDQWPLWLEVQVDGQPPMFPRSSLGSVPYARVAGRAEELFGGPVDADSLAVGGAEVVDASGAWVGAPIAADWADLVGVPSGFADGVDADLLGGLSCADGQALVFSAGSGWTCADYSALMGAVDADLTALRADFDALTLTCDSNTAAIETLDGRVAVLESGALVLSTSLSALDGRVAVLEALSDADTLSALSCLDGAVAKWDAGLSEWICADDLDTRLTEAEVDAMVADNGFAADADLVGLGADLAALESAVAGLGADLAAVDADVGAVDVQVTSLGGRVTTLEGTVATQGGLLTTLNSAVSTLGSRLSAAEAAIITLASTAFSGSFLDLSDVPAGLEDGDDDTLSGLACADGEVPSFLPAAGWVCTTRAELASMPFDAVVGFCTESASSQNSLTGYSNGARTRSFDGAVDGYLPPSADRVEDCGYDGVITSSGSHYALGDYGATTPSMGTWSRITRDGRLLDPSGQYYEGASPSTTYPSSNLSGSGWTDAFYAGSAGLGAAVCGVRAGAIVCNDRVGVGAALPAPPASGRYYIEVFARIGSTLLPNPTATSTSSGASGFVCGIDSDNYVECTDQHSSSTFEVPVGPFERVRLHIDGAYTTVCGLNLSNQIDCRVNRMQTTTPVGWQVQSGAINAGPAVVDFRIVDVSIGTHSVIYVDVALTSGRVVEYEVRL